MPSSNFAAISPIMSAVMQIKPKSVLDIGCGNGKYGFLVQEYMRYWMGIEEPHIDAIEIFDPYLGIAQSMIYKKIIQHDALEALWQMEDKEYDLILAVDILEHYEINEGALMLDEMKRVGKNIIVCTPIKVSNQGAVFGNEYETHRSQWEADDILQAVGIKTKDEIPENVCIYINNIENLQIVAIVEDVKQ